MMTTKEELKAKAESIRQQRRKELTKRTEILLKQFEEWGCSIEDAASACACALNVYDDPMVVSQIRLRKVLRVTPPQIEQN